MVELARWGKGVITDLSYAPDGKSLAVASSIGIFFYDTTTFEQTSFIDTEKGVNSAIFSPDGKTVAAGLYNGTIKIFQVSDRKLLSSLDSPNANPILDFSPDGKILASASKGVLALIPIENNIMLEPKKYSKNVASIDFSPDGTTLAIGEDIGNYQGLIEVLQIQDGVFQDPFTGGHVQISKSVSFSPDGRFLASDDGNSNIWRISDRKLLHLLHLSKPYDSSLGGAPWLNLLNINFSPKENIIAAGYEDGSLRILDINGGIVRELKGHRSEVIKAIFSPDGQTIASASRDGVIKFWKVADGSLAHTLEGYPGLIQSISFSPNSQYIALGMSVTWGAKNSTVQLWNSKDGTFIRTMEGHIGAITSLVFSPDSETLASGSTLGIVRIGTIADGKFLSQPSQSANNFERVWGMAFSPDGNILAYGERKHSYANDVILWKKGQSIERLKGHTNWVNDVAFSPDSQTIISGSGDKTVKLWQIYGKKLLQTFEAGDAVWSVAFSPDGQSIAASSGKGVINLWKVSDGSLLSTWTDGDKPIYKIAFSRDGKILAGTLSDWTVKLWKVSDGSTLVILAGHNDEIANRGISFSPDGKYLASGSYDGTIRIWGIR